MTDRCRQCGTLVVERAHPRRYVTRRDRDRCKENGLPGTKRLVWITRFWCDCQWKFQLRYIATDLLSELLPDPDAQHELRRRSQTDRKALPPSATVEVEI